MTDSEQRRLRLAPDAAAEFIAAEALGVARLAQRRVAIGLVGGPGVGKSTIAAQVVERLNAGDSTTAALVPMDGFHMRHAKLEALGIDALKGAPQTFEAEAFAHFLWRLRAATTPISGPGYSREIEDVVDDGFTVAAAAQILIVEGNYLLLAEQQWDSVKPMLECAIFLDLDRALVRERLLARHGRNPGFSAERNLRHVDGVDLVNFDLVATTRARADIAIDLDTPA